MPDHRRWMLYVPELEPEGFLFFYFKGETGRSYSLRRYPDAHRPPALRRQHDLRYAAEEILAMATHKVEVEPHPVGDLAYWRKLTEHCEATYLVREADRALALSAPRAERAGALSDTNSAPRAAAHEAHGGRFVSRRGRPLRTLDDWRALHPPRHWRAGYSAMELARTWSEADDFPTSFRSAFHGTDFAGLRLERAVVEHETTVPGRGRPSCTDLMVFAHTATGVPVVVGVEGKVDESFGPRVSEWRHAGTAASHHANRQERLEGLCGALGLEPDGVGDLRYQLLHRVYAAVAAAQGAGAGVAVVAVHSLEGRGPRGDNWRDFLAFCQAMGREEFPAGELVRIGRRSGVDLWVVWVTEDQTSVARIHGGEA